MSTETQIFNIQSSTDTNNELKNNNVLPKIDRHVPIIHHTLNIHPSTHINFKRIHYKLRQLKLI